MAVDVQVGGTGVGVGGSGVDVGSDVGVASGVVEGGTTATEG